MAVYVSWHLPGAAPILKQHFVLSLEALLSGRVWTVVTHAFSHFNPNHLLGNLLGLYFFGRGLEEAVGRRTTWAVYLLGALGAAAAQVAQSLALGQPGAMLGASGAVMALGAAYAWFWPYRKFLFYFFLPMPAWALLGIYAVLDLGGVLGGSQDGVAHMAHLGGLVVGLLWAWRRSGGRFGAGPRRL